MPLPFVAWGVVAGVTAVAGAIMNKTKKKAYAEGYRQAEAESNARINELTRKLSDLQRQREHVKDQFRDIVGHLSTVEVTDKNFFSKIAAFVKGYSTFHIYVVGIISVAKSRCLELDLPREASEELKSIVLGVMQGGFPDQLKKDINEVWDSTNRMDVQKKIIYCQKRIPEKLALEFHQAVKDIDEAVVSLHELHKEESKVQEEIRYLQAV